MWRFSDWECSACEDIHEDFVDTPFGEDIPKAAELECKACGKTCEHKKIISRTAFYTYDREFFPQVHGGAMDTMGFRKPPPPPELPDEMCFDQARDLIHSKKAKERWKEKHAIHLENKAKRERAKAAANGAKIDIRTNPLPGDPPMEKVGKVRRKVTQPRKRLRVMNK